MQGGVKRKYAFISYNHKDVKIAKWLQRKLESYKLPTEIYNEFENSRYLRPIFRDRSDLNSGILTDELRNHLESSKFLIVICSPNSATSTWVSDEVRTFIEWGRLEYIIPFIIDGTPNSSGNDECFPYVLLDYFRRYPDKELLGIDIREDTREKAFVRLVSRMLGLAFDDLWQRHKRSLRHKRLLETSISIGILGLLYWFAIPFTLHVRLIDEAHQLPLPQNLDIEIRGGMYSVQNIDTMISVNRLPGYLRGCSLPIQFSATYYKSIQIKHKMGIGLKNTVNLYLKRDDTFALFSGVVCDKHGKPIEEVTVQLEDLITKTDVNGTFCFNLPISKQTVAKRIQLTKEGYKEFVRLDECPSERLSYILQKSN